ncbi:hypothetical protein TNCV_2695661 [Trichonephila clavipes]|nr:hypothetical protein TNCV_2695661 [Trichonephila clavipes]
MRDDVAVSDYFRLRVEFKTATDGENESQVAEILNGVYGADTVTANYVQFWLHRFRSDIFNVKVAPRP